MPRYRYKAVSASGTVTEGEMEAVDRQAVIDGLHQQGGTPIRADPVSDRPGLHLLSGGLVRKHGFGAQAVALMTREMATLLRAGLPVDRALSILMEISKDRNV